jgi:hypothetical protein
MSGRSVANHSSVSHHQCYNPAHMNSQRLTCLIVILLCAMAAHAQSGRRQTKPAPAAPVPTPTPEPTPTPKKTENKEPELVFFVGADEHSNFGSIPLQFYSAAVRGCADRLQAKSGAAVTISQTSLSRGEAIKKAQSGDDTYVILITLGFDAMARSYDDLQLHFTVFAPTTSKVVTTGVEYLNGNRAGPVVVGRSRLPGGLYREDIIRQGGERAADRSWKAINKKAAEATTK